MYNATLYFKQQLDLALAEALIEENPFKAADAIHKITYLKLAIFALERLEEQDANK
jgi:hypothetical protein